MRNKQGQALQQAKKCLAFINESKTAYQTVCTAQKLLQAAKFTALDEKEDWQLIPGKGYYVIRNDSSIIAFRIPNQKPEGFHIAAAHSDSPCYKLKPNPEMKAEKQYIKLDVEGYGGMIHSTWLDRSLSVAGRISVKDQKGIRTIPVTLEDDLLVIPNLAIHMNRDVNKGYEWNIQKDMLPLGGSLETEGILYSQLAKAASVSEADILGADLFLYVCEPGRIIGLNQEMVLSPRLDDLQCAYSILCAMAEAEPANYITVGAVFDNEEVGSRTGQGAASTFLSDTLERIGQTLSYTKSDYLRLLADSFLISADNAHALHPNHPDKSDPNNRPVLNGGIVIKHHGGQKYTTDAYSEAYLKDLCKETGVPWQDYSNRSDLPGGATLGNISIEQVSIRSIDIGLAQLAMHSAVETAGVKDIDYLVKILHNYYQR